MYSTLGKHSGKRETYSLFLSEFVLIWKSSYICTSITDPNIKRIVKKSMKAIYDTLASLPSDSMHHVPASCVYSRFGRIRSVSVESIRCKRAAPQLRPSRRLLLCPLDDDFDNDVEKDEEDVDPSLRRVRIVLLRPPPNEDSPFLMCCMDEDNRFKNPLPIVVLALVFFYRTGNNLE